jgi:hypothetical protein
MTDWWQTTGGKRLVAKTLRPDNKNPIQPTLAAFVQVIMMLRKIFIQDSVLIPFGNIESFLIQPTCHSKGKSTSQH